MISLGPRLYVDFPPETESRVEKQTTTSVLRKSFIGLSVVLILLSYKILVESKTL